MKQITKQMCSIVNGLHGDMRVWHESCWAHVNNLGLSLVHVCARHAEVLSTPCASCQLCRPLLTPSVSTGPLPTSTWKATASVTTASRLGHRSGGHGWGGGLWNNVTWRGDGVRRLALRFGVLVTWATSLQQNAVRRRCCMQLILMPRRPDTWTWPTTTSATRASRLGHRTGAAAAATKHLYHIVWGFLQHVVVCVHFTWVLQADPSIQLRGPGLGHGGQRNHQRGWARHARGPARNAQWWRTPGAVLLK